MFDYLTRVADEQELDARHKALAKRVLLEFVRAKAGTLPPPLAALHREWWQELRREADKVLREDVT